MITPITSAITIANRKLRLFRTAVNFAPNSYYTRGNDTTPTMDNVVRNATDGMTLTPAPTNVPTSGNAINAGTNVIVPSKAPPIVARRTD